MAVVLLVYNKFFSDSATHTHTRNRLSALVRDYLAKPFLEETLSTHTHEGEEECSDANPPTFGRIFPLLRHYPAVRGGMYIFPLFTCAGPDLTSDSAIALFWSC